jgi:hypothetical protein
MRRRSTGTSRRCRRSHACVHLCVRACIVACVHVRDCVRARVHQAHTRVRMCVRDAIMPCFLLASLSEARRAPRHVPRGCCMLAWRTLHGARTRARAHVLLMPSRHVLLVPGRWRCCAQMFKGLFQLLGPRLLAALEPFALKLCTAGAAERRHTHPCACACVRANVRACVRACASRAGDRGKGWGG